MKNNKKIVFIIIIIIGIICSFINIKTNVRKEKQIIKEMSESTQVSNLQTQINTLNKEHTDYANYIQTSKRKIANAITEMGVETSENATADTMANNIRNISGFSSGHFPKTLVINQVIVGNYSNQFIISPYDTLSIKSSYYGIYVKIQAKKFEDESWTTLINSLSTTSLPVNNLSITGYDMLNIVGLSHDSYHSVLSITLNSL